MEEFLGLIVFSAAIVLMTVGGPWFRRRDGDPMVERLMLTEAYAIVVIGMLAGGSALVIHDLSQAWAAGETTHVIVGVGVVVVLLVAARFARNKWRNRAA